MGKKPPESIAVVMDKLASSGQLTPIIGYINGTKAPHVSSPATLNMVSGRKEVNIGSATLIKPHLSPLNENTAPDRRLSTLGKPTAPT